MQQYADDAANLLDALKIESINVFGVSFGGMVAQEFTIRHPSRVKKLVLACTSSGGKGGSSYPLHELEELDPEMKLEKNIQINDLRITDDWVKTNQETWKKIKLDAKERKMFSPDQKNLLKQLSARRHHDTFDRLKEIDTPVLLTGGKYDGIAPVPNMEAMHQQIRESELRSYEGS